MLSLPIRTLLTLTPCYLCKGFLHYVIKPLFRDPSRQNDGDEARKETAWMRHSNTASSEDFACPITEDIQEGE